MTSLLLLVLPIALAACGSNPATVSPAPAGPTAAATGSSAATQTSEGGQVTAVVSWGGPASGASFDVKLDTHSVDLASLDLSSALLRNDRGQTMSARPWTAPAGGHHREGTLEFAGDARSFFAGATWIELVLRNIGGLPERTLRWTIGR